MMKYLLILALVSLSAHAKGGEPERKVTIEWNPDCDGEKTTCNTTDSRGSYTNLVHVLLTGESDVVHLLYSDIQGFSIVFARTNLTTKLSVDWTQLLAGQADNMSQALKFSEIPAEWFAYEIPSVIEFDDQVGTADMTKVAANATYIHQTKKFIWKKFQFNTTENFGWFEGSDESENGTYKFTVNYPGKEKRDVDLPHLMLNPESTSIDFVVDSVVARFNRTKIALNLIILSNHDNVAKESKRNLDDEYTPGTFRLWSVEVKNTLNEIKSYLQWKPIFYYFAPKTLENSTITKEYDLNKNDSMANGISLSFFEPNQKYPALNISFGLPGSEKDGFYYKFTNYSSFTFAAGFGAPPEDKMSFIVTLVIIVGFGLPAIVIVVGLIVLIYRKLFRSNTSEFSRL